ncbi:hypothetical protein [Bartonella doshiae]|uniref:Uncharacterized protein n=2 Tax=Bartonella doshiae TaxID=33044 RepID=A0A380ZEV9_BARDO|nr:hypothetical protein [Bartonella doshiae]EJF79825.1 hypothetical protein MCS_01293 [Bartonella doshiae NCTC 12862 = ATCC 700133]MBB6158958.1 hypothetical protein [Bartonella doshiae]SUV45503.1 Uncharacterised protein [Bartonella doshiae]
MEKRIQARRKAYFKKLYHKISFVCIILCCTLVVSFAIMKIIRHFSASKQETQQVSTELDIPAFDLRVYCKEISASVIPDVKKEVYHRCINLESEAYFAIREMWDDLSQDTKKKCVKMVRPGDGNYFLLRDCLINEKDKARNHF